MFGIGPAEILILLAMVAFWGGLMAVFLYAIYHVVRRAIRDERNSRVGSAVRTDDSDIID